MSADKHRVLLIFLDGVGIGAADPKRNPFFTAKIPFIREMLGGQLPSLRNRTIEGDLAHCIPLDARLGVPGLPQSGTGQTALYTGVNAAQLIGQHFGPYLYSKLKPVVEEHNIFRRLLNDGCVMKDLALANAFPQRFFDYLNGGRTRMVAGMYAALTTGIPFRTIEHLKSGHAVSTDITAVRWKGIGHPDAPVISAYEAGQQLARIAKEHSFTLYEYFLTDKAGHDRTMALAISILEELDEFFLGVYEDIGSTTLLITSDHGNMEDLSTKSHTRNPVPLLIVGKTRYRFRDTLLATNGQMLVSVMDLIEPIHRLE